MSGLPPFLRTCDRIVRDDYFPSLKALFWSDRLTRWREAELRTDVMMTTSWESLLETENASEQLMDYLLLSPDLEGYYELLLGGDDHLEDLERQIFEDETCVDYKTIVWLSDKVFISDEDSRIQHDNEPGRRPIEIEMLFYFDLHIIPTSTRFYRSSIIACYRIVPRASFFASSVVTEVDFLLRLLSKHKSIKSICWKTNDRLRTMNHATFPASLSALEAFVGQAQSPRDLLLDVPMSLDQYRLITTECSKKVTFIFSCSDFYRLDAQLSIRLQRCLGALIDAMKRNTSPANISLCDVSKISQPPTAAFHASLAPFHELIATFHAFMAALEVTTSLEQLTVSEAHPTYQGEPEEGRIKLFGAISRNVGLQTLIIDVPDLSDSAWEALWNAVALHPTLQTVRLGRCRERVRPRSPARDQILVQAVRSNTVLCDIVAESKYEAFHDPQAVYDQIQPILQVNRFRPIVQFIKQVKDAKIRETLFALTLLGHEYQHSPSTHFLLLKDNPDLLVQFACSLPIKIRELKC